MSLKVTSVRLDDETLTRAGQMAGAMDRPRAWLMAGAIKQYVACEEWFLLEVEKGVKAAEEGRLTDHKNIKAKWEAKRADQMSARVDLKIHELMVCLSLLFIARIPRIIALKFCVFYMKHSNGRQPEGSLKNG